LAQYFVADTPPVSLVDRLAQRFTVTQGDIRVVLHTLFHSPEFMDSQYYGVKFKTPYQYLISLVRATGSDRPDLNKLARQLIPLEMPLYQCLTPDGYRNTQQAWLSPDAMLRRISLATAIANGNFDSKQIVNAQQLTKTLGYPFSKQTQAILQRSPPQLRAALILGSPEMMRY
jgi:uncharacterized protein (DUF1800 family)